MELSKKQNKNYINIFMQNIKEALKVAKNDTLFKSSFYAIALKTLLFIVLISDNTATGINIKQMFDSAPPVLVYIAFILIFLSFSFLLKGKGHLLYFIIINLLLTILYIGDIWYYRSNHSFLNYHMFKLTSNLENLGDSVFSMFRPVDILFFIDFFIIIILCIKELKICKNEKIHFKTFILFFCLPVLYLSYAHIKVDVMRKCYENQYIFRKSWNQNQTMSSLTPIGYHLFDAYDYYEESKPYILSSEEKNHINKWFNKKQEVLPDNKYKSIFKGKNLIVIQVESLENFVINQKVNGEEITPNLNKLLKNSLYFNNFHEQTHNGTTSDAELMANTSIFPVRSGSTFFRYPTNTYTNSLPNIMENLGYNTMAVHPDKGSYWNWLQSLKSIGFNKCIDASYFNMDEIIGLGLSDESFLKQLTGILEKEPQPFYSFSITLTSHAPFNLPEKYKGMKLESPIEDSRLGNYFQCVHYTDKQLGTFLDTLDKKGLLDNSIVVIYGDHEGIHKFYSDELASTKPAEEWWLSNDFKIPFIIYNKGMKGEVISINGGQVDILPTLSYVMGADYKDYVFTSMGRNLLNTKKDFAILSNGDFREKGLKEEDKALLKESIELSDKIIRSNYLKEKGESNEK